MCLGYCLWCRFAAYVVFVYVCVLVLLPMGAMLGCVVILAGRRVVVALCVVGGWVDFMWFGFYCWV